MTDDATYGNWLAAMARRAGYDTSPGNKGRTDLARAVGVDPSVVGKALDGKGKPTIATQRRLAKALDIQMRDMLIRSGTLDPEDLPGEGDVLAPDAADIDLYAVARKYGIPADQVHLFVASAEATITGLANTFAGEQRRTIISTSQTGGLSAER